jgi:NhaP-type Na+/H+ or K+/H+ antiporter
LEAGKNVFTLFRNRGWDAIIADDLVGNVLFLMSVVVGALAGLIGLIIEATTTFFEDTGGGTPANTGAFAFFLCFIVGLVICSVLMSTIGSAVNAVVVLFAEAPAEFQQNYPDLSQQMRDAWLGAFPNSLQ